MKRRWRDNISNESNSVDSVVIAVRIADRFKLTVPTASQLQSEFGMSLATAYRWRKAVKVARRLT